jgi:hypothetical protein
MTSDQITGIMRAVLAALGGFILAKGWVSAETWAWLTGGILTVGGTLWSMWSNRPAGIAGSAQALPGVNVMTTPAASSSVVAAVNAAK